MGEGLVLGKSTPTLGTAFKGEMLQSLLFRVINFSKLTNERGHLEIHPYGIMPENPSFEAKGRPGEAAA